MEWFSSQTSMHTISMPSVWYQLSQNASLPDSSTVCHALLCQWTESTQRAGGFCWYFSMPEVLQGFCHTTWPTTASSTLSRSDPGRRHLVQWPSGRPLPDLSGSWAEWLRCPTGASCHCRADDTDVPLMSRKIWTSEWTDASLQNRSCFTLETWRTESNQIGRSVEITQSMLLQTFHSSAKASLPALHPVCSLEVAAGRRTWCSWCSQRSSWSAAAAKGDHPAAELAGHASGLGFAPNAAIGADASMPAVRGKVHHRWASDDSHSCWTHSGIAWQWLLGTFAPLGAFLHIWVHVQSWSSPRNRRSHLSFDHAARFADISGQCPSHSALELQGHRFNGHLWLHPGWPGSCTSHHNDHGTSVRSVTHLPRCTQTSGQPMLDLPRGRSPAQISGPCKAWTQHQHQEPGGSPWATCRRGRSRTSCHWFLVWALRWIDAFLWGEFWYHAHAWTTHERLQIHCHGGFDAGLSHVATSSFWVWWLALTWWGGTSSHSTGATAGAVQRWDLSIRWHIWSFFWNHCPLWTLHG